LAQAILVQAPIPGLLAELTPAILPEPRPRSSPRDTMARRAAALFLAAAAIAGTGVLGDDGVAEVVGAAPGAEVSILAASAGSACAGQNWQTDFGNRMFQCGVRSGGRASTAGACMSKTQGVSAACGQCMGNLIGCGASNCLRDCCAGSCHGKQSCLDCNAKHCNSAFQQCAGSWPPRRLHEAEEGALHV